MHLAQFILRNIEAILAEWEGFARSLPPGTALSVEALRNDAERMLRFVAADIETVQSLHEQSAKATGRGPVLPLGQHSAAEDHGLQRAADGFTLAEMISEYRALRASVTRLWKDELAATPGAAAMSEGTIELSRFHESIDQILTESVARFSAKLEYDRDLYLTVLGHDLRNPLQAIIMSAQALVLGKSLSGSAQSDVGRRIAASGGRALRLVDDLTEFARGRLGANPALSIQRCDLKDIVGDAIDELRIAHPDRRLDYVTDGDCAGDWDPGRIHQVVSNLIANAIQYGRAGTSVAVSVQGEPEGVLISVRNAGEPIPVQHRVAMFDPLRRAVSADPDSNRRHLGLGLYIARSIARNHGGDVELASSDERGTVFTVRLPRRVA